MKHTQTSQRSLFVLVLVKTYGHFLMLISEAPLDVNIFYSS
jgi:hypothetical protein